MMRSSMVIRKHAAYYRFHNSVTSNVPCIGYSCFYYTSQPPQDVIAPTSVSIVQEQHQQHQQHQQSQQQSQYGLNLLEQQQQSYLSQQKHQQHHHRQQPQQLHCEHQYQRHKSRQLHHHIHYQHNVNMKSKQSSKHDQKHNQHRYYSFSRMMDLGGSPSGLIDKNSSTTIVDVSKTLPIQVICFDFDVLIQSMKYENNNTPSNPDNQKPSDDDDIKLLSSPSIIQPDIAKIQDITNALKIRNKSTTNIPSESELDESWKSDNIDSIGGGDGYVSDHEEEDNMNTKQNDTSSNEKTDTSSSTDYNKMLSRQDIRNKYADKLSRKSISSIEGIQSYKDANSGRGDASGHFAAKQFATKDTQSSRWMVSSGTGTLLKSISIRSMKIILLPKTNDIDMDEIKLMNDFSSQLHNDVPIYRIYQQDYNNDTKKMKNANDILNQLVQDFQQNSSSSKTGDASSIPVPSLIKIHPNQMILISDKDSYIKSAKDIGMMTIRLRLHANAKRGNISAHYTITNINEVNDILNQLNGISFNQVHKMIK